MQPGRLEYVSKFEEILVDFDDIVGFCGFCVQFCGFEIVRFLSVFGVCGLRCSTLAAAIYR